MSSKFCLFLCLILSNGADCTDEVTASNCSEQYTVNINGQKMFLRKINHFWKSTGLCPPDPHSEASKFLLGDDMKYNLILIGSLPNNGIEQVRIHWLLQLINMSFSESTPEYDFTHLDDLVDILKENDLIPGFELMGNPSNYFNDFENDTQIIQWKTFIQTLAQHVYERYGKDYVGLWNWESWNEPDNKRFDSINITTQGFLNYYDASVEGLMTVNDEARFGGPAQHLRQGRSPMSWALLDHCVNGTSYFTKNVTTKLDFISVHVKGGGASASILEEERKIMGLIHSDYPTLSSLPFYNDEADPLVNWILPQRWRADNTYAAIALKIIAQHWSWLANSKTNLTYHLLSNDNAFLSYHPWMFEQRTLLARFQMNNTDPPHVIFIRKPIYSAMALLSLLGEWPVYTSVQVNGTIVDGGTDCLGVMAAVHLPDLNNSKDSWNAGILLYNSDDTNNESGTAYIKLKIQRLLPTWDIRSANLSYVWYVLDNSLTNPYQQWTLLGKPDFPNRKQLLRIFEKEGPIREEGPTTFPSTGTLITKVKLRRPGIRLLHICSPSEEGPGQVFAVRLHNITRNQILISWSDSQVFTSENDLSDYKTCGMRCSHSSEMCHWSTSSMRAMTIKDRDASFRRCVKTYEVEFSRTSSGGPFSRINPSDTIFNSFYYLPPTTGAGCHGDEEMVRGYYRVRAVDYWNRCGPYSSVQPYGVWTWQ